MNPDQRHGAAPQLLQRIELPLLTRKDVDDDIIEIHEKPAGVRVALNAQGRLTGLLELLLHRLPNGLPLPPGLNRHQDERVRKAADVSYVKQDDVMGLTILGDFYSLPRKGDAVTVDSGIGRCGVLCHDAILRHPPSRHTRMRVPTHSLHSVN